MLTIRIKKRATIGNLQGPYESTIANRGTWITYSYELDRIVKFFGPDKSPDDIFKQDVANFRAYLKEHLDFSDRHIKFCITVATSYWTWMMDFGFASINPFKNQRVYKKETRDVNVIIVP